MRIWPDTNKLLTSSAQVITLLSMVFALTFIGIAVKRRGRR